MVKVVHIRCNYCGEPLIDRTRPYCPPCNLYLCYRAMPILLGMLFPLNPASRRFDTIQAVRSDHPPTFSYDDEPCIMVDYHPKKTQLTNDAAYEEELCIMVPY
jgi:hypothetical protein